MNTHPSPQPALPGHSQLSFGLDDLTEGEKAMLVSTGKVPGEYVVILASPAQIGVKLSPDGRQFLTTWGAIYPTELFQVKMGGLVDASGRPTTDITPIFGFAPSIRLYVRFDALAPDLQLAWARRKDPTPEGEPTEEA